MNNQTEQLVNIISGAEVSRLNRDRKEYNTDRVDTWINGVQKAAAHLRNGLKYRMVDGVLSVSSPSSGEVYAVNWNVCQCQASEFGLPCWHKACHTIIAKLEAIEQILNK